MIPWYISTFESEDGKYLQHLIKLDFLQIEPTSRIKTARGTIPVKSLHGKTRFTLTVDKLSIKISPFHHKTPTGLLKTRRKLGSGP